MIKEANIDELALLLAISNSRAASGGGGGGSTTPSQVKDLIEEYLVAHPASKTEAGAVIIGDGISIDENGVISIDGDKLNDMVSNYLEENMELISDDDISNLWP